MVATPYESDSDIHYAKLGEAGSKYRENRNSVHSGIQTVAAAIENMLLAAWSMGIGGVWMTAPIVAKDLIQEKLDIKEGSIIALVAFGYPSQPPKEVNRKPLDEVVRYYR